MLPKINKKSRFSAQHEGQTRYICKQHVSEQHAAVHICILMPHGINIRMCKCTTEMGVLVEPNI